MTCLISIDKKMSEEKIFPLKSKPDKVHKRS